MTRPISDPAGDWERPMLVGCCPSSGSTLLSVILDSHPRIFNGPELAMFSHPFVWSSSGQAWRDRLLRYTDCMVDVTALPDWSIASGVCPWIGFCESLNFSWYGFDLEALRQRIPEWESARDLVEFVFRGPLGHAGKTIWCEKSPTNLYGMQGFLDQYPHGRGIVMLRDGRDVVCSLMNRGYAFAHAASIWVFEAALTLALSEHPRVHLVRYEDLVADPLAALQRLMDFLEIEASMDHLLAYQRSRRVREDRTICPETWKRSPKESISGASVGRWRTELAPIHTFLLESMVVRPGYPGLESLAGRSGRDLLVRGGYDPCESERPDSERLASWLIEEGTALSSLGDERTFHYRFAPPLAAVQDPGLALVPCVARLNREIGALRATIERQERDGANMRRRLDMIDAELQRRIGVRNGVREALRSIGEMVKARASDVISRPSVPSNGAARAVMQRGASNAAIGYPPDHAGRPTT
jgi:hypothetical protein